MSHLNNVRYLKTPASHPFRTECARHTNALALQFLRSRNGALSIFRVCAETGKFETTQIELGLQVDEFIPKFPKSQVDSTIQNGYYQDALTAKSGRGIARVFRNGFKKDGIVFFFVFKDKGGNSEEDVRAFLWGLNRFFVQNYHSSVA